MDYQYSCIYPQVIFFFDSIKNISRTIFLSKDSMFSDSFVQGAYNYLLSENIILFSIWYNLDYNYENNDIFNPFNIKNNIKKTTNKTILYDIDLSIVNGAIFCVTNDRYTNSQLSRSSEFLKNIYSDYIQEIIKNIYKNNYKLFSSVKKSEDYSITCNFEDMIKLSNIDT